ncbi:hypothetical protein BC941DRAFT_464756 [Chlamydoabsidia padenii]|nr:hypothetical protein BC941DRAFT_464756 [Chlamydoabsidia padenii]
MYLTPILALLASSILAVSGTALHNHWRIPKDFGDVAEMESSIRVPKGSDPIKSFWMANGWSGGYLGMQHNTPTTRTILFSAWDAAWNDDSGGKVIGIKKGKNVIVEPFGGEGEGMHAKYLYNWTAGETIYFRLRASVNEDTNSTDYSAWWRPETQKNWNFIATLRVENMQSWLTSSQGFLENYGHDYSQIREGFWGNFSVTNSNGETYKPHANFFKHTAPHPGDVYEYRFVDGEAYMRIDGPKDKGIYPPTNPY